MAVSNLFKASQYCVIVKSTALDHDMFSKFRGVGNFDDFVKGVFDNRVGKSCRNICYRRALLLCLFYLGVHEYSTAGSQVNGMLCKQGCLCKILYTVI